MRKRYLFLTCLGMAAGLTSQLPLSWVAPYFLPDSLGQTVSYSGTVWGGQVRGLDYIGTANFKLSPKALFHGGLPMTFASQSSAMSIFGNASRTKLKDIQFSGILAKLPTRDGRLKELAGQVNIRIDELEIENNTCTFASGQVSTDFLALNQARWQWQGPTLAGPISCEDGDMLAELSGRENRQIIRTKLRLSPNGNYAADITVQTDQAEAGVVLPLYGFEKQGRQFKLTEQGQWR